MAAPKGADDLTAFRLQLPDSAALHMPRTTYRSAHAE